MTNIPGKIVVSILLLSGCSSTFLASRDGRGYYLGSTSEAAYDMFCRSGDLLRILEDVRLPDDLEKSLYENSCGEMRSGERVRELYTRMTPEERKELRMAFKRQGYDINYLPC